MKTTGIILIGIKSENSRERIREYTTFIKFSPNCLYLTRYLELQTSEELRHNISIFIKLLLAEPCQASVNQILDFFFTEESFNFIIIMTRFIYRYLVSFMAIKVTNNRMLL